MQPLFVKTFLPFLFLTTSALIAGSPSTPEGSANRFTVVSGNIEEAGKQVPCLVRVDSFTGETWILKKDPASGASVEFVWTRIAEHGETTSERIGELERMRIQYEESKSKK